MVADREIKSVTVGSIRPYGQHKSADPKIQSQLMHLWEEGRKFIILSGPPGTGKTRAAEDSIHEIIIKLEAPHDKATCRLSNLFPDFRSRVYTAEEINQVLTKNNIRFIWDLGVLHPQYTYEDLIRGYRLFPGLQGGMSLEVREGLLGFFSRVVQCLQVLFPDLTLPKGVLVLDEINRAPIGQLFGEAIYGLDRRGESVVTPFDLPGVGCNISFPTGLYLLGTMNSIDRATTGFDFALRRRFTLINLYPQEEPVLAFYQSVSERVKKIAHSLFLKTRALIEEADQTGVIPKNELIISQAYFLPSRVVRDEEDALSWLAESYLYRIIPTIMDYREQGLLDYKKKNIDAMPCNFLLQGELKTGEDLIGGIRDELKSYS